MKIQEVIQQRKFVNSYQKLGINILFSASWLTNLTTEALKPYDISWQQFNILRILRGLKGEPATVKLLSSRMIDRMSNASRLVEKLKKKGLVKRISCIEDRRCVEIYLTEEGKALLVEASNDLEAAISDSMQSITEEQAELCSDLLDQMRS